ncbi:hypothetical protein MJO29_010881, partial [Puccinia striiformis f. sp. tritici]
MSPIPTGLCNSPHHLRRRINHLANPGTYDSIMESLIEISEAWEQQISVKVDFTSFPAALVQSNSEEQNARLLTWHAKSRLYAHAVVLHAERQPLYWGTHILQSQIAKNQSRLQLTSSTVTEETTSLDLHPNSSTFQETGPSLIIHSPTSLWKI